MAARGGYRPNSGRPSLLDEELRARVLTKSWELLDDYIKDETEPRRDRIRVAGFLAQKSVPQNLAVSGELTHNIFMQDLIAKSKGAK